MNYLILQRDTKKKRLLKVGFEKAYHCVTWNYLRCYLFGIMGFGSKWLVWMEACVLSGIMYVFVNGSPTNQGG